MKSRILVIEDSPEARQDLLDVLHIDGYIVSTVTDACGALVTVGKWAKEFDAVVVQEAMQGHRGVQVLHEVHSQRNSLPVIVVTRDGSWDGYSRALDEGAVSYLTYPLDGHELLTALESALRPAA